LYDGCCGGGGVEDLPELGVEWSICYKIPSIVWVTRLVVCTAECENIICCKPVQLVLDVCWLSLVLLAKKSFSRDGASHGGAVWHRGVIRVE